EAVIDQDQPDTGHTPAPEQAKAAVEAVKDHRNLPAPDHAAALRTDELNAGGESAGPVAGNRDNPLYPAAKPSGSDLSENRDEKGAKGEAGLKAGPVTGLSHGAIHVNTEKFPVDALSAKPVESVKPEAVFEKLSTGVRMSLGGNGREVSLNLAPEHLGVLHIRMSIEESSVKARIVVESEAAKTILDSDSGKLREVFARQGLTLDRYTVELGANAFSESSARFSESAPGENPYGGRSHWGGHAQRPDNTIETRPYIQSENTRRASGGVDLFA
ncbi:MAG: flagellar hook-length control protein FliK, partial [Deltaproteobacteria bacterium]|nr:flagellar hook-length control protein FliK [Deltaproteobacteria bacterium]